MRNASRTTALRRIALAAATTAAAVGPLAAPAAAQHETTEIYQWRGDIPAGSELRVYTIRGNITVRPARDDMAQVRGERGRDRSGEEIRFETRRHGHDVVICALEGERAVCGDDGIQDRDRGRGPNAWAHLVVELPEGVNLRVGTGGGEVEVSRAAGEVHASSGSGRVTIESARGPVRASTGSGSISISTEVGPVSASTGSGGIDVRVAALASSGDMAFSSGSGNITLTLPADFSADLSARTGSGEIDSDFPLLVQGRMQRSGLVGTIGGGGRSLRISTGSGSITLRRHGGR